MFDIGRRNLRVRRRRSMSDLKSKISNFFNRMFKKLKKELETFGGGQVSAQTKQDLMKPIYPVDVYSDDPWAEPISAQQIKEVKSNEEIKQEIRKEYMGTEEPQKYYEMPKEQLDTDLVQDSVKQQVEARIIENVKTLMEENHEIEYAKDYKPSKQEERFEHQEEVIGQLTIEEETEQDKRKIIVPSGAQFVDIISGTDPIELFARQVKFIAEEAEYYVTNPQLILLYKIRQIIGQKKYTIWNVFDEKLGTIDMSLEQSDDYIVTLEGREEFHVQKKNIATQYLYEQGLHKQFLMEIKGLMEDSNIDDRIFLLNEVREKDLLAEVTNRRLEELENTKEVFHVSVKQGADKVMVLAIGFLEYMHFGE